MTDAEDSGHQAPPENEARTAQVATRSIVVAVERPYEVRIGPGVLRETDELVAALAGSEEQRSVFTIADARAHELHGARLGSLAAGPIELLAPGEDQKRFEVVEQLLDAMVAAGLDRGALVVAFGGGVVGDLAGLVASLFMRGVPFVQLPTTLLSQVDSSVGGKTAVNLAAGKNLAGTFHQPRAVLADTQVLATLDDADYRSGLGEVLKTALLDGEGSLNELERLAPALAERDPAGLSEVVASSISCKARVVALDPTESGPRRVLNLGHTFAHAIERVAGYGRIPHGVAVACGLDLALRASHECGQLQDPGLPERVAALARCLDLTSSLAELQARYELALDPTRLIDAMASDKKGRGGRPRFVLVRRAGELALDIDLERETVQQTLAASLRR